MASPQMRMRSELPESAGKRRRSALRLLGAERSEEIFPVLVEEIVALGHPRALITKVDFETSEILPIASLNCSKSLLQKVSHFAVRDRKSAGAGASQPGAGTGSRQKQARPRLSTIIPWCTATRLPVGKPSAAAAAAVLR